MTAIASFLASDGLVLCADTERTIGSQAKRSRGKICSHYSAGLQVVLAGAGDDPWIEASIRELFETLHEYENEHPIVKFREVREVISKHAKDFFRTYVRSYAFDPDKRPSVDLLMGLNGNFGRSLMTVHDNIMNESLSYAAIGSGSIVATDLIERTYKASFNMKQMASLAIYIMERVKSSVPGVGGHTDIMMLGTDRSTTYVERKQVKELEIIHSEIELGAFDAMVSKIVQHGETIDAKSL